MMCSPSYFLRHFIFALKEDLQFFLRFVSTCIVCHRTKSISSGYIHEFEIFYLNLIKTLRNQCFQCNIFYEIPLFYFWRLFSSQNGYVNPERIIDPTGFGLFHMLERDGQKTVVLPFYPIQSSSGNKKINRIFAYD